MNLTRYATNENGGLVKSDNGNLVKHSDAAALVAKLEGERDEYYDALKFCERMANHHAQKARDGKPMFPAKEILGWIQHYPPIAEITQSYSDGKIPETPNPWEELTTLRARVSELTTELGQVAEARDAAERFASKVERGEVKFAKACDENLQRIAAMPLGKKLEENLSDTVARVLSERDNFLAEVARLRGALKACDEYFSDEPDPEHGGSVEVQDLRIQIKQALTAAPVATEEKEYAGSHHYPGVTEAGEFHYTSDCSYGCGCWMGATNSGGPDGVNPFGECPKRVTPPAQEGGDGV